MNPPNGLLVYAAMMVWHWLFFWQFFIYGAFYVLHQLGYTWVVISLVLWYIVHVCLDKSHITGGGLWMKFNKSWVVDYAMHYFPTTYVKTCDLSYDRQYIFVLHPHGLMPWLALPVGRTREWAHLFPGIFIRSLCASPVFKIPVAREAVIWNGSVDATRFNAKQVLESGSSLSVFPGGSEEAMRTMPGKETLVLSKRKGFVRLAFENGCDLVPVYAFGVNDLYGQMQIAKQFRLWLLKKTQFAWTFGWGKRFFNLLPAQRPIYIVIGKPINVAKIEHPTDEQIDEIHAKYTKELEVLFETHKEQCGFGDRDLTII